MTAAAIYALAFAAVAVIAQIRAHKAKRRVAAAETRLNNLRANCFVTNERGHRTRYANASPEVRARAESANA